MPSLPASAWLAHLWSRKRLNEIRGGGEPFGELAIEWQNDYGGAEGIDAGTAVNAVVHTSRNFDEKTDKNQEPGTRTLTLTATNAAFTAVPNYCLTSSEPGSDTSALSSDKSKLTCVISADATHGVASRFVVPTVARGANGEEMTISVTDDLAQEKTTRALTITANDSVNVAVGQIANTTPAHQLYGLSYALELQAGPKVGRVNGPLTFQLDLSFNQTGTGRAWDYLDFDKIYSFPESRGFVTTPPTTDSNRLKTGKRSNAGGASWTFERNESTPQRPYSYTVTVDNLTVDPGTYRLGNGGEAGGVKWIDAVYVKIPPLPKASDPDERWGIGSVTLKVSDVSYVSALTGETVTDQSQANFNAADDSLTATYTNTGSWGARLSYLAVSEGKYSTSVNTTSAPTAWSGDGVMKRGTYTRYDQILTALKGDVCVFLPPEQKLHFTGDYLMLQEYGLDNAEYQGYTTLAASGLGDSSPGTAYPDKPLPEGLTMLYYTGPIVMEDNQPCNETSGWTTQRPDDMSTVTALKVEGYDPSSFRQSVYPEGKSDVPRQMELRTYLRADADSETGTKFLVNTAVRLDSTNGRYQWSAAPGPIVKIDGLPYGITGTNSYHDVINVGGDRAVNAISLSKTYVSPGDRVTATVTYGSWGVEQPHAPLEGDLTVTLPEGARYVEESSSLGEPEIADRVLTWKKQQLNAGQRAQMTFDFTATGSPRSYAVTSQYAIPATHAIDVKGATAKASASYQIGAYGSTIVTISPGSPTFALKNNTGTNSWKITTQNDTPDTQAYVSTLSVLPYAGDDRGTVFDGAISYTRLVAPEGAEVWVSKADPKEIARSPLDAANGEVTAPNEEIWSRWDGKDLEGVTAVWTISKEVPAGTELTTELDYQFTGAGKSGAVGNELHASAISAAQTTQLKTIEAAASTMTGEPSQVQIDKAWTVTSAKPGDTLTFFGSVKLDKEGNGLHDVVVKDLGGNGLEKVTFTKVSAGTIDADVWNLGAYTKPGTYTYEGSATVAADWDYSSQLVNKVVVTSKETPEEPEQCTANETVDQDTDRCDTVTTELTADFALEKSGGTETVLGAQEGSLVQHYELAVTGTGTLAGTSPQIVDRPAVVTGLTVAEIKVDGKKVAFEDGAFTIPGVPVQPGQTVRFAVTITYAVDTSQMDAATWQGLATCPPDLSQPGGGLVNSAQFASGADSDGEGNNSVCAPVTGTPDIRVVKTINGDDANDAPGVSVEAGSEMDIAFTVTNTGNQPLTDVTLTDDTVRDITPPAQWDARLAPGQSVVFTATMAAPEAGVQHHNTATVQGTPPVEGVPPVEDTDPAYAHVPSAPAIRVVKTINGDDANEAPGVKVEAGSQMQVSFEVSNVGNVPLTQVRVSDDVMGDIVCPATELDLAASMTCTATLPAPQAGVQHANTATATGVVPPSPDMPSGGEVTDTDPAHAYVPAVPAIDVTKYVNGKHVPSSPGLEVKADGALSFTFDVTNTGNIALVDVQVTDTVATDVTCPKTSLSVGETMTCAASAAGPKAGGTHKNIVTVSGRTPDNTPGLDQPRTVTDTDLGHAWAKAPTTPPAQSRTRLSVTGADAAGVLALAAVLSAAGVGVVSVYRRRRA